MKIISQAQLQEEKGERQPKATRSIFRRMIQRAFAAATEEVDLAEQRIQLDHAALFDLYESARRSRPGCTSIQMPLEAVADILSPSMSKFEVHILLQKLRRSRSAVLSMTPGPSQPSGCIRPDGGTDPLLTVWFLP